MSASSTPTPKQAKLADDPQTQLEEPSRINFQEAEESKAEGTEHFLAKRWDEALTAYKTALGRLPKRKQKPNQQGRKLRGDPGNRDEEEDEERAESGKGKEKEEIKQEVEPPLTEEEQKCAKLRSMLNANVGACHVKLGEHKEAVEACTEAICDDPRYIKALQRRAASNEILNTWSSLASSQEDYETLLKVLPESSPQKLEVARSLRLIKPRVEAAQKTETAEMMSKLKGVGNSILGRFGLSTDNFKFEPNGQGGYSMNFSQ